MHRITRLAAGIALGLLISVAAHAGQKSIKQADLPSAVQRTAEAQGAGATVSGYTREVVEGETLYRMALVADAKNRAVTIASDGTVVSVENEIAWDAVPADVQATFTRAAGKGKLGDFRSVTKEGTIVSYNALLETNGNRDRVSIKPHAAPLAEIPSAPATTKK